MSLGVVGQSDLQCITNTTGGVSLRVGEQHAQNILNEMVIINGYNEQAIPTILNFKIYALYILTNFHKQLKSVISVKFGTPWTTTCVV